MTLKSASSAGTFVRADLVPKAFTAIRPLPPIQDAQLSVNFAFKEIIYSKHL